jgi:hypothetical protein
MKDTPTGYSYEDLEKAMGDLAYHKGQLKEWQARWNTAKSALDSHQRDIDRCQDLVDKAEAMVKKVMSNMERK